MKRRKIQYLVLMIGLFVWFLLGWRKGWISFEGNQNSSRKPQEWIQTLSGLQTIGGDIFIFPGNEKKLLDLFSQAQHRIRIQVYEFTHKDFKKTFKKLADQGVEIKIMIENKKYQQYQNTFTELQNYFSGYKNVEITSDYRLDTSYMHAKYLIIDSGFVIQTANLTHSSMAKNRERGFWSTDTGVLLSLENLFLKDWNDQKIGSQDIHPNLVVCNINCRPIVEHLISSAKKNIYIQNQYISDPKILALLKAKSSSLDIKIILSDTKDNLNTQSFFGKSNLHIFGKNYYHTKMLLIDDALLLLSSINLSSNALDNNREMGILLTNPENIQTFKTSFFQDWSK